MPVSSREGKSVRAGRLGKQEALAVLSIQPELPAPAAALGKPPPPPPAANPPLPCGLPCFAKPPPENPAPALAANVPVMPSFAAPPPAKADVGAVFVEKLVAKEVVVAPGLAPALAANVPVKPSFAAPPPAKADVGAVFVEKLVAKEVVVAPGLPQFVAGCWPGLARLLNNPGLGLPAVFGSAAAFVFAACGSRAGTGFSPLSSRRCQQAALKCAHGSGSVTDGLTYGVKSARCADQGAKGFSAGRAAAAAAALALAAAASLA